MSEKKKVKVGLMLDKRLVELINQEYAEFEQFFKNKSAFYEFLLSYAVKKRPYSRIKEFLFDFHESGSVGNVERREEVQEVSKREYTDKTSVVSEEIDGHRTESIGREEVRTNEKEHTADEFPKRGTGEVGEEERKPIFKRIDFSAID